MAPVGPGTPGTPCRPCRPCGPDGPVGPTGPPAPVGPVGPPGCARESLGTGRPRLPAGPGAPGLPGGPASPGTARTSGDPVRSRRPRRSDESEVRNVERRLTLAAQADPHEHRAVRSLAEHSGLRLGAGRERHRRPATRPPRPSCGQPCHLLHVERSQMPQRADYRKGRKRLRQRLAAADPTL